jgi:glutamate synthase (NADPH/NADH) large chain
LINKIPESLDEKIYDDIKNLIGKKNNIKKEYKIKNTNRAIGTRLSHYIYKKINKENIRKDFIKINLFGCAGQSLGAFGIKGLKLKVIGNANDYVGKSLSGATIVIKPPKESNLISNENTIIGNTVLYGATSGQLFAAGQSGERFAVRNSGAEAVIEGCDSNGCEYMTGGSVVILGKVGDNFAAGMTGGMAFVYDPHEDFKNYVNPGSVIWQAVETDFWKMHLKNLISEHLKETQSEIAHKILDNFNNEVKKFQQVCPKEMLSKLSNPISFKLNISKVV